MVVREANWVRTSARLQLLTVSATATATAPAAPANRSSAGRVLGLQRGAAACGVEVPLVVERVLVVSHHRRRRDGRRGVGLDVALADRDCGVTGVGDGNWCDPDSPCYTRSREERRDCWFQDSHGGSSLYRTGFRLDG